MRAKAIMVLGTGSDVGKSVIASGLCRVLSDWGYRVAPFKAQNMSNNSFVTEEGGEMGRAQVVQAECARVRPHVDMNPILLKPSEDSYSQVIIQGKAVGHFAAKDYFRHSDFRDMILRVVKESYERLASEHEIIVLEGAGSCAELNLKDRDCVNLWMADYADAACLLVGDIDRGGIFASLIGTLDLLSQDEQDRIIGLIVNKFRGDIDLFRDGIRILEERTAKKVWGVLPYDRELWIEAEDGLPKGTVLGEWVPRGTHLDIAVVLLPRMSNFTDFEILKHEPGVSLRYVKHPEELGNPDLVILPGTKSTIAGLQYIEGLHFPSRIRDYFKNGGRILGICGGYQMLGEVILDPEGVESKPGSKKGLGLFQMTTEFYPEKILRQINDPIEISLFGRTGTGNIKGYEIHMGRTVHSKSYPPFGESGAIHESGRVAGTYYHGLFDSVDFRQFFLKALREDAGKPEPQAESIPVSDHKEMHYARLADLIRDHLNLDPLRELLGLPCSGKA